MNQWEWMLLFVIAAILILTCCESISRAVCRGYFREKREHLRELSKLEEAHKFE
jgi:hypothetical protein